MPTAEATLLAACARAMREEEEALYIGWNEHTEWVRRWGQTFDEPHLFTGTRNECHAYIAQRAFAAGLRVGAPHWIGYTDADWQRLLAGDEG